MTRVSLFTLAWREKVRESEQLSEFMCKHAEKENGLHDLIEIMLESMMVAERGEYLRGIDDGNKGNGYRLGHTYGYGRRLAGNAYAWRYAK